MTEELGIKGFLSHPFLYRIIIYSFVLNLLFGYFLQMDPYYDIIMNYYRIEEAYQEFLPKAALLFSFGVSVLFSLLLNEMNRNLQLAGGGGVVGRRGGATGMNGVSSSGGTMSGSVQNSAFVFIKPHANTSAVQDYVKAKLQQAGITITNEGNINGTTIDRKKLIDQHYYAIASKATILAPKDIPVPADKFQRDFGEPWKQVLMENRAVNAMQACARFNCTPSQLNTAWGQCDTVTKFGGGFYCGKLAVNDNPPLYVFNAFFMAMRSKFVGDSNSIHYYEVSWSPSKLSWSDFRGKLLGPTDPSRAPDGSIRHEIYQRYIPFGLKERPNKGDNGVHASASPLEGLAEKVNWLGASYENDAFGSQLLKNGITAKTLDAWCLDPQVNLPRGKKGSIFDALEDKDVEDCFHHMMHINKIN